jgi:hypothetical protein
MPYTTPSSTATATAYYSDDVFMMVFENVDDEASDQVFADVTILPYLDLTHATIETEQRNPSLPHLHRSTQNSWLCALCSPYFIRGNLSAFSVSLHPSSSLFLRFAGRNR